MFLKRSCIFLSLLIVCSFSSAQEALVSPAEFIPTSEWQVIPPDTPVPPGLHYRMDLSTGVKMAKLLEPDEQQHQIDIRKLHIKDSPSSSSVSIIDSTSTTATTTIESSSSHDLASEPHVKPASEAPEPVLSPFQQKEKILLGMGMFDDVLKKAESPEAYATLVEQLWQQRQDEVRAVYDMMEHPDVVIDPYIHALWDAQPHHERELLQKLEKLEELISTADMALVFVQRGGWTPLVNLLRPKHSAEVRTAAAFVVGSALRQSEENKVLIFEPRGAGAVPLGSALYQLMEILDSREDPAAHHEALLSKAVYALAAAANTNQEVQSHLLGPFLSSLGQMLSEAWPPALKIKVMQFGTDMMTAAQTNSSNTDHYALLSHSLASWCRGINNLTAQVVSEPARLEKTLEAAVQVVKPACPRDFHDLVAILKQAQKLYATENNAQLGESFREELLQDLALVVALD